MSNFLFFLLGLILGGLVVTVVLCCLQINRINDFAAIIRDLQKKLNNK